MIDSIKGPSEHLSWKEMACHDSLKTPYPVNWRTNRAIVLAEAFEMIRTRCGNLPIKVLSCYRTPIYNASVGGAKLSQHQYGRAIDLHPPIGITVDQFYRLIFELSKNTHIKGLGKYLTFVHVDIRPSDKLITWKGTGV